MENELIYIGVGWLLGIISSIIVDVIKKCIDKGQIMKGIIEELKILQVQATAFCFSSTIESHLISDEYIKWISPYFLKVIELNEYDYGIDINTIKDLPEDQFSNIVSEIAATSERNRNTTMIAIKFESPYLNSKLGDLSLFDEKTQFQLLKIKRERLIYSMVTLIK